MHMLFLHQPKKKKNTHKKTGVFTSFLFSFWISTWACLLYYHYRSFVSMEHGKWIKEIASETWNMLASEVVLCCTRLRGFSIHILALSRRMLQPTYSARTNRLNNTKIRIVCFYQQSSLKYSFFIASTHRNVCGSLVYIFKMLKDNVLRIISRA